METGKNILEFPLAYVVAFGRDTKGNFRVAKGVIAVGQFAVGTATIAQFGVGFLFGQFIVGLPGLAQEAVTVLFGVGQLATGCYAIGQ